MSHHSFTVAPFSAKRQLVVDSLSIGAQRHIVHGFIEIDVTNARRLIREHRERTGEALSFTAFICACFAQAIEAHKGVQAYRDWRNRLVIFDEVDVVVVIEPEAGGVAMPHIIRAANLKTFREIHAEIRRVQTQPRTSKQTSGWLIRLGLIMPGFVRRFVFRLWMKNPYWLKRNGGTVVVSPIGMFGRGGGWGVGVLTMHTLGLFIGGIAEKPGVVNASIEIREYLDLTISMDHDIVDGAPAARFARTLIELIENAEGLR